MIHYESWGEPLQESLKEYEPYVNRVRRFLEINSKEPFFFVHTPEGAVVIGCRQYLPSLFAGDSTVTPHIRVFISPPNWVAEFQATRPVPRTYSETPLLDIS